MYDPEHPPASVTIKWTPTTATAPVLAGIVPGTPTDTPLDCDVPDGKVVACDVPDGKEVAGDAPMGKEEKATCLTAKRTLSTWPSDSVIDVDTILAAQSQNMDGEAMSQDFAGANTVLMALR